METLQNTQGIEKYQLDEIVKGKPMLFPNDVIVLPIGVNHIPEYYNRNQEELSSIIAEVDFIVSEADPLVGNNSENRNGEVQVSLDQPTDGLVFYNRLMQEIWQKKKSLLYVDPETLTQSYINQAAGYLGGTLALIESGKLLHKAATRKLRRRDFLKGATIGLGSLVFSTSTIGADLNIPLGHAALPIVPFDMRTAGSVVGLNLSAQEKVISGEGAFFIGWAHLDLLNKYSGNIPDAENHWHFNIGHIFPEGSALGPSPCRLWQPTPKANTFKLVKVFNRG